MGLCRFEFEFDDPAHRGNGAAMPTDEDDKDGYFFFDPLGGFSAA